MAKYLSPEWFTEMQEAASTWVRAQEVGNGRQVRIAQHITGTPYGDVNYVLDIGEKLGIELSGGSGEVQADTTFAGDYENAAAMHRGERDTHQALFDGQLRVSGNINMLLENDALVRSVAPVFDKVRQDTTY